MLGPFLLQIENVTAHVSVNKTHSDQFNANILENIRF